MAPIFEDIIYRSSQIMQVAIFLAGCYFFFISVFGWFKREEDNALDHPPVKTFALVVPAHNEENVIGHMVESLRLLDYPNHLYDIFVIADNCTDNTAQAAAEAGARVYQRFDNEKRGKGFALDWIFKKIYEMPESYDAVCVFDADNLVSPEFLLEMNKHLCKGSRVIQGYIDSKNPYDSWISISYSIAFWLSNRIYQLPRYYLGLSCGLCGTGFCIDIGLLRQIGWETTSLTEDLEFTMKLALNGMKVSWAHNAVVYDEKPITFKATWGQRLRWMQGHADCARKYLGSLFKKAFTENSFIAFDCGIYLFQPLRFILLGMVTIMMWIQTLFPDSPIYHMQYLFPTYTWYILALSQMVYGPVIVMSEKKFCPRVLLGFLVYPFYCLTWVPIAILGFLSRDNKSWCHTKHTRAISITEIMSKTGDSSVSYSSKTGDGSVS
jgi:cellulose synthase/poly-beta-1,6-N-acetylglucosamine synthase-like glycosyltransferase